MRHIYLMGIVQEAAAVWLNGKLLKTLIGPTFQMTIDVALLKQNNLLALIVTNRMPNRLADLEKWGVHWKKFIRPISRYDLLRIGVLMANLLPLNGNQRHPV